jgi:hypothetical protein
LSCPFCYSPKRTDKTYECWSLVGDDELGRSERCIRNEIKLLKASIKRLEEAGEWMAYARNEDDFNAAVKAWTQAKEAQP